MIGNILRFLSYIALVTYCLVSFVFMPKYAPALWLLYLCWYFGRDQSLSLFTYCMVILLSLLQDLSLSMSFGTHAIIALLLMLPFALTMIQRLVFSSGSITKVVIVGYFCFGSQLLIHLYSSHPIFSALQPDWIMMDYQQVTIVSILTTLYVLKIQNACKEP